jgi:tetratricopeptide (TPR) repeat protein
VTLRQRDVVGRLAGREFPEINEQVARLRKVLDEATALLTRNSADVGARVAKNETDIAQASGHIEEAKHLLAELQKRIGEDAARLAELEQGQQKIVERVAPSIPEDKESLWKDIQSRLAGGMREDARRFLRAFVQRFPQDGRGAQAQILIGQSFAVEGKHANAISEYQKVMASYPRAPEVPEAMWLLGEAFVQMKFCKDSQAVFDDMVRRYPKSPRVTEAKKRVRDLQQILKDKKLCTS